MRVAVSFSVGDRFRAIGKGGKLMAKAIVVMEMPENCRDCGYFGFICRLTGTSPRFYGDGRVDNCPLIGLPEKIKSNDLIDEAMRNKCFKRSSAEIAYYEGKAVGWNDCIAAIEGKMV